ASNHFFLGFDGGIIPQVSADHRSIVLNLQPWISNDAGHGVAPPERPFPVSSIPPVATTTTLLPSWFQNLRSYSLPATNITIIDGQMVLLGGLTFPGNINVSIVPHGDEDPVKPMAEFKRHPRDLKIFLTATIVNADGTR